MWDNYYYYVGEYWIYCMCIYLSYWKIYIYPIRVYSISCTGTSLQKDDVCARQTITSSVEVVAFTNHIWTRESDPPASANCLLLTPSLCVFFRTLSSLCSCIPSLIQHHWSNLCPLWFTSRSSTIPFAVIHFPRSSFLHADSCFVGVLHRTLSISRRAHALCLLGHILYWYRHSEVVKSTEPAMVLIRCNLRSFLCLTSPEHMHGWVSECMDEWVCAWLSQLVYEWVCGWVYAFEIMPESVSSSTLREANLLQIKFSVCVGYNIGSAFEWKIISCFLFARQDFFLSLEAIWLLLRACQQRSHLSRTNWIPFPCLSPYLLLALRHSLHDASTRPIVEFLGSNPKTRVPSKSSCWWQTVHECLRISCIIAYRLYKIFAFHVQNLKQPNVCIQNNMMWECMYACIQKHVWECMPNRIHNTCKHTVPAN